MVQGKGLPVRGCNYYVFRYRYLDVFVGEELGKLMPEGGCSTMYSVIDDAQHMSWGIR
jgi:hypothetical protein